MILRKYLTTAFLFTTLLVVAQHETCSSSSADGYTDLNTIGKCAIENFKKSNKKEYVQISTRSRYVRRKSNAYLTKLKSNLATAAAAKKVIRTIDNVDHLPTFFSCNVTTKEEEVSCFKDEIQSYISSSLHYPEEFLNKGVEDKVLTTFTINTNGYATDIKVESSKGISALENEAKRVINNLPQLKPAKYNGKATEVRHKVYVNFDLNATTVTTNKPAIVYNQGYIKNFVSFDQVTEKPIFITCADYGVDVRQECIKETITHDVLDNLTYPFDAAAEGIEGRVWVRFVIDKDGYVSDITTSGPLNGVLLEEEAERLVKLLPKFIPGKHNGDYVNVEYFIPIDFHLDE